MGRIRSIYPDACISETLAKISPREERTFWRLLTHCDDRGRCYSNARLIKAAIYPLHDDMLPQEVQKDLDGLACVGLIQFYTVEGRGYLWVCSWDEFQHPKNPTPSKLPAPENGLPSPTPVLPQGLPTSNPLELGDGDGDRITTAAPSGAGSSPGPKRSRRTRTEIIQGFSEDVKAVVNALGSEWKAEDPVDGRKITLDVATFAQRVSDILAQHQEVTPAVLIEAGQVYLGSSRNRYKAPQFFFGPGVGGEGPPWLGFVRAILTRKSLPEAS